MAVRFITRWTVVVLALASKIQTTTTSVISDLPEDQVEQVLALYHQHCDTGYGGYGPSSDPNVNIVCKEPREYTPPQQEKKVIKIPRQEYKKQVIFVEVPETHYRHEITLVQDPGEKKPTKIYVLPGKASHDIRVEDQRGGGRVVKPEVFFLKGGNNIDGGYPSGEIVTTDPVPPVVEPSYGPPSSEPSVTYGPPPTNSPASSYGPPLEQPPSSYGPPLEQPPPSYGPPPTNNPPPSYGPPEAPPSSYGPPAESPPPSYGPPPANNPPPSYGPPSQPPPSYGPPPAQSPPPSYGPPPANSPPPSYGPPSQPPPSYGPPPANNPQPSYGPPEEPQQTYGPPPTNTPPQTTQIQTYTTQTFNPLPTSFTFPSGYILKNTYELENNNIGYTSNNPLNYVFSTPSSPTRSTPTYKTFPLNAQPTDGTLTSLLKKLSERLRNNNSRRHARFQTQYTNTRYQSSTTRRPYYSAPSHHRSRFVFPSESRVIPVKAVLGASTRIQSRPRSQKFSSKFNYPAAIKGEEIKLNSTPQPQRLTAADAVQPYGQRLRTEPTQSEPPYASNKDPQESVFDVLPATYLGYTYVYDGGVNGTNSTPTPTQRY